MPRNGSGTFTLDEYPVDSGTTIESAWANEMMLDLMAGLTDSLSRSGLGGMLAPFANASGTVTDPGITWAADGNSGWRYENTGTPTMYAVINNVDKIRINPTGLEVFAAAAWRQVSYFGGAGTVPNGTALGQMLWWDNTSWKANANITVTVGGGITATQFSGPLIGNVTGDVAGDVNGNLIGNVTGDVTGSLFGNATTATTATNALNADNATLAATATLAVNATNADDAALIAGQSLTLTGVNTFVVSASPPAPATPTTTVTFVTA